MEGTPCHEISDLRSGPGELSFEARIGAAEKRIWFRSETEVDPYPEAALATALMPAMRSGETLTMSEPISPRVLRTQREFQAIQRAWSLGWEFGDPPLREVEVEAPTREPEHRPPSGRVAAFFSGGVDSWATVLGEADLTDLVFVRGIDILPANQGEEFADRVETRLRDAAVQLGLPLHVVTTNLRELSEPFGPAEPLARWETYYGCAMAAVALFLGREFDRILIAGESDYEVQVSFGANWMVDQLWSTEELEIVDDGGRFSRVERTQRIAAHPTVGKSLRVCWRNPGGAYNCGRCRKCLMTMTTLEAIGALEAVETFPSQIDLEELSSTRLLRRSSLHLWEDVLDAVRSSGKRDLERAVASVVVHSRRDLGLPPGYRRRAEPAPPSLAEPRIAGTLMASPQTAEALAQTPVAAFLVGSYDGSGNYGDIAQLDGALRLLGRAGPGLLTLPVIERQYAQTHEAIEGELLHRPQHVLYFDDGGGDFDDRLVPLRAGELRFALSYLYGGGFLNPSWGERKLAMLRAVEELAPATAKVTRIASGQQVDADWIAGLEREDAGLLAPFEFLGARDDASAETLAQLQSAAAVVNSGDDAVGILAGPASASAAAGTEDVVNVHIAEHEWVTSDPDAVRSFFVGLVAELSSLAGRSLRVRPILAYLDPRVDERDGLERFAAACAERGIEVEKPRVLRPAGIAADAPQLANALLSVSCSYHVALTSLMLGVPAVILGDNPYYDQKARGLLGDFELPAEFSPSSGDDPRRSAELIAPTLFVNGGASRTALSEAAARVAGRRTGAEADLLGCIVRGTLAAVAKPESPRAGAGQPEPAAEEAERRAAQAVAQLNEVIHSSSWRVTAPLRRLATRLRNR